MSDEVVFETRDAAAGRRVGFAWLNRPAQINALNLAMCEALLAQLRAWASDESIVCVFLGGRGERGMCAGGDVAAVVREIRSGRPDRYVYGDAFFEVEYQLDAAIHAYPKPLLTWAHGITMGGGIGLSVGGSHRIVTDGAKLAMPEIHIGLFPDTGGGWFLNRVPGEAGVLLALTGLVLNEADALFARLADYRIEHARQRDFIDGLCAIDWGATRADHHAQLTHYCRGFAARGKAPLPDSALRRHYDAIRDVCTRAKPSGVLKGLQAAARAERWFEKPLESLANGSPTAACVSFEYLRRTRRMSLAEVLALDRIVARQCQRHHDFPEGVRAVLIDKTRDARWSPPAIAEVSRELVAEFFEET